MNDNQVKAVMIAVAIVVALIAAVKIRRGLRRFFNSAEVRLVRELARSVQNGELQQEDQPKSLGGMTSIYLPQILRDFPEFNWEELQAAVEAERYERYFWRRRMCEAAGAVRIHKTVISRYQKYGGTASILCETAAEYWPQAENQVMCAEACNVRQSAKEPHGQNGTQQIRKKQTVCAAELLYVYDSVLSGTAASLVCPNCGAPVEQLGAKQCRYCGSVLEVSGANAWKVQNVRERN